LRLLQAIKRVNENLKSRLSNLRNIDNQTIKQNQEVQYKKEKKNRFVKKTTKDNLNINLHHVEIKRFFKKK